MKQKAIITECITDEKGKQTFLVRHPNGSVLKVCENLESYNQFCFTFFNEDPNECKK